MHRLLSAVVSCCALVVCAPALAQDLPTTHDLGITITPDDLLDAIQETQDFWGPVRRHIAGENFNVAPLAARQQSVAFLTKVHDGLHERLFLGDEASATDLLNYLGQRMRKFELYRQLRPVIADDAKLAVLVAHWEAAHREINQLAAADRPADVQKLLAGLPGEMQALGLSAETTTRAMPLWKLQAECMELIRTTEAGGMMTAYEAEARELEMPVVGLLRNISLAADWVLIVRAEDQPYGTEEFLAAWDSLSHLHHVHDTAAQPATVR